MMEPPQYGLEPELVHASPICHGYSFFSVATPPTIFKAWLAIPHWQLPGEFVVTGPPVVAGPSVVTPGPEVQDTSHEKEPDFFLFDLKRMEKALVKVTSSGPLV